MRVSERVGVRERGAYRVPRRAYNSAWRWPHVGGPKPLSRDPVYLCGSSYSTLAGYGMGTLPVRTYGLLNEAVVGGRMVVFHALPQRPTQVTPSFIHPILQCPRAAILRWRCLPGWSWPRGFSDRLGLHPPQPSEVWSAALLLSANAVDGGCPRGPAASRMRLLEPSSSSCACVL